MNWTKIPTNLLISRTPDNELVAIVKYQLLWADLEYQPTDEIALRYMTNKQLASVKHYLNDIEAQVVSDIKSTINHRGNQKMFYQKKQLLKQNADSQYDSQYDDKSDSNTDGADKIRLDKIRKEKELSSDNSKKKFTHQSEFYVDGQYFDEFPVEALPLLKKHWSSRELERIRKDLACKPAHNTTIERLLQEYPSDILPYKLLGEKKSIPLTKKQWEWFQEQSITPAVKVKAIDILENYALSHPDKFKKFTDPSLIMGRKSGWAYVEAFKEPYRFENQEELIAELKRVGLR